MRVNRIMIEITCLNKHSHHVMMEIIINFYDVSYVKIIFNLFCEIKYYFS